MGDEQSRSNVTVGADLMSLPMEIHLRLLTFLPGDDLLAVGDTNEYFMDLMKIELTRASRLASNRENLPQFPEDFLYQFYGNFHCARCANDLEKEKIVLVLDIDVGTMIRKNQKICIRDLLFLRDYLGIESVEEEFWEEEFSEEDCVG